MVRTDEAMSRLCLSPRGETKYEFVDGAWERSQQNVKSGFLENYGACIKRRHSFDDYRDVESKMVREVKSFFDEDYRLGLARDELVSAMREREWGVRQLLSNIVDDGTVDVDELRVAMEDLGVPLRWTELVALMTKLDVDGNGVVTEDELFEFLFGNKDDDIGDEKQVTAQLLRRDLARFDPVVRATQDAVWKLMDADNDGKVSKDEYLTLHYNMYLALREKGQGNDTSLTKQEIEEEWRDVVEREWEADARGQDQLDKHLFGLSLFQLADAWSASSSPAFVPPTKAKAKAAAATTTKNKKKKKRPPMSSQDIAEMRAKYLCFLVDRVASKDDSKVGLRWNLDPKKWLKSLDAIPAAGSKHRDKAIGNAMSRGAKLVDALLPPKYIRNQRRLSKLNQRRDSKVLKRLQEEAPTEVVETVEEAPPVVRRKASDPGLYDRLAAPSSRRLSVASSTDPLPVVVGPVRQQSIISLELPRVEIVGPPRLKIDGPPTILDKEDERMRAAERRRELQAQRREHIFQRNLRRQFQDLSDDEFATVMYSAPLAKELERFRFITEGGVEALDRVPSTTNLPRNDHPDRVPKIADRISPPILRSRLPPSSVVLESAASRGPTPRPPRVVADDDDGINMKRHLLKRSCAIQPPTEIVVAGDLPNKNGRLQEDAVKKWPKVASKRETALARARADRLYHRFNEIDHDTDPRLFSPTPPTKYDDSTMDDDPLRHVIDDHNTIARLLHDNQRDSASSLFRKGHDGDALDDDLVLPDDEPSPPTKITVDLPRLSSAS